MVILQLGRSLKLGLLLSCLVSTVGCPQLTSSRAVDVDNAGAAENADAIGPSATDSSIADVDAPPAVVDVAPVAAPIVAAEGTLGVPPTAAVVPQVCNFQPDWQRPSATEHRKLLSADPRYASALETEPLKSLADELWQHSIFSFTTYGLSARMEPIVLSGLLSAADAVWETCYSGDEAAAINAGEMAEVWLIDHRLVDLQWQDERYVLVVEPADSGLQVVQFNRLEAADTLPLSIVSSSNDSLESFSADW